MSNESANARMIEKIKALFAKANDASVTEEEALSYLEKAQELLAKYNIEMTEIEADEAVESIEKENVESSYANIKWRQMLICSVSEMFFCKAYLSKGNRKDKYGNYSYTKSGSVAKHVTHFMVVGKEHNRKMAVDMFHYLEKTVVRLSKGFSSNSNDRYHFEQGCGIRLTSRVRGKTEAMRNPVKEISGGLPALYNNELNLVNQFMSGVKITTGRSRRIYSNSANSAGYRAANDISLDTQINARSSSQHLLA